MMSGLNGMTDFFEKTKTALLWLPSKVMPIQGLSGQAKLPDAVKPESLLLDKKPEEELLKYNTLPTGNTRADIITAEVTNEIEDEDISELLEDKFVQDAIKDGPNISDYMQKIQSDLASAETDAVHQYFQNVEQFADLYNNLKSCDVTLEKIETTLHNTQLLQMESKNTLDQKKIRRCTVGQ